MPACAAGMPGDQSHGKRPNGFKPSLGFKKRNKAGLPEMTIRRESIANPELAHDSETDAVGEGPLFVAMFAKQAGGGVETCRFNPLQAERLAAFDRIKKVRGGPMTMARQQQSDGFVGHVFGGEEMAAFAD